MPETALRKSARQAATGLMLALVLCACSHKEATESAAGTPAAARAAAARARASGAGALARALVGAVTQTKPGTAPLPVQVKFALRARPELNQPVAIDVQLIPTASNLDRISARVDAEEGLELVGTTELPPAERPLENTPIDRSVEVLAKQNGIFTVTATVAVDMGGQVSTQLYQFPVIAGSGLPEPAKAAAAARTSATAAATPAPAAR